MKHVFEEVVRRAERGERLALCVVVGARGSTPQGIGAKMLVTAAGETAGTLGGGCVEAEVRRRALELLARAPANPPPGSSAQAPATGEFFTFRLDSDLGWDDGLICGGTLDVFTRLLGAHDASEFRNLLTATAQRRPATFQFTYTSAGGQRTYVETLEPAPLLLIAGAGHVGQALAALAAPLGFEVAILDDRAEFASAARFGAAQRIIVGDVESELAKLPLDASTYVVIVTRGHRGDGRALAAILRRAGPTTPRYVGLIGSKRKILTIMADLAAQGIPKESLQRVHAPIGLNIGAQSVPEIAVSIAAELIAIRGGLSVEHAPDSPVGRPMKITPEQLTTTLHRAPPPPPNTP